LGLDDDSRTLAGYGLVDLDACLIVVGGGGRSPGGVVVGGEGGDVDYYYDDDDDDAEAVVDDCEGGAAAGRGRDVDGEGVIAVTFVSTRAGMPPSERSVRMRPEARLRDAFSVSYRRAEGAAPPIEGASFVVGEWGEVPAECDVTAEELGVQDGDVTVVEWTTTPSPPTPPPPLPAVGGMDFSSLLGETRFGDRDEISDDEDDGGIVDLRDGGAKAASRIVLRVRGAADDAAGAIGGEMRFAIDENATPLSKLFEAYLAMTVDEPVDYDRWRFHHHGIGDIPRECEATAAQLGIRNGEIMQRLAVHHDWEGGPATAMAMAMVVGRVAHGDGGGRWFLDMTRNCDVVVEEAVVVLTEPGGDGVHFRIDRRATCLTMLFIAYADWLGGSVSLDELRFLLGGRRLPRDSDETAHDNGVLDGDTIHVIRIRVMPKERQRDDRSFFASTNAARAVRVGVTLFHVATNRTEFFLVDPSATLHKVFHKYSQERVGMPLASLRFLHGDTTLYPDDTPSDVGIRSGDTIHVLTKSHQKRMLELTPNAVEAMKRGEEKILFDPIVQVVELKYKSKNVMVSSALPVFCMEYGFQTLFITPLFAESVRTRSR
jgi:hypothetical protein